ncbi:glycosyltransferase 87 family protein [Muricoccus pecuniae]|uniref:Phosphoribulokinase n=1 Tax=Muricoccus pecuniae TaxID=693023 RepID=A0A840Y560_9PROT|nr:glycosyltransferase 87 family protein [Roseomonas pecuniae]MBB5693919.1 uridine kinase [Roseomonas pecuniae]
MALIPHELLRDRRFLAGLLLRLAAILLLVPRMQPDWSSLFQWDAPWSGDEGVDPLDSLYGPVMVALKAPFTAIGTLADSLLGTGHSLTRFALGLGLIIVDYALLLVLRGLYRDSEDRVVLYYWLSPLVLFIVYWHGQADLLPVLLTAASLLLLRRSRPRAAGAMLGLAVATKVSALAVLPFLLIFLWSHRRYRDTVPGFALACGAVILVLLGPWMVFATEMRQMLAAGGELHRVFNLTIHLGEGQRLYVIPIAYLLLLYGAWHVGRMSFNLLYTVLGTAYLVLLLLTPESGGWYLWLVPFLLSYQLRAGRSGVALTYGFAGVFILLKLLVAAAPAVPLLGLEPVPKGPTGLAPEPSQLATALLSMFVALGGILNITMLRRGFGENDFFGIARQPLAIGIAGDSGTGKDTLALALGGLFGEGAVTGISGDDYHLFERRGKLWQAFTHLDPRANDLEAFSRDALSLIDWRPIMCRHYDHATGLFTPPRLIRASDVVLVTGLHALYAPALRAQLRTAVFLDMDEGLRRFFKIRRDVHQRGHTLEKVVASIERRRADYEAFIRPQREHADVVFSLLPADPELIRDFDHMGPVPLKLRVRLRNPIGLDRLARLLIALCGAQVDVAPAMGSAAAEIVVDGNDVQPEDIHLTALQLVPELEELLARNPAWQTGITGIMQLVVLQQIAELAPKRR